MKNTMLVVLLLSVCATVDISSAQASLETLRGLIDQMSETMNPRARGGLGGGGMDGLKEKLVPMGNKFCTVLGALGNGRGGAGGLLGGGGSGAGGLLGGGGGGSGVGGLLGGGGSGGRGNGYDSGRGYDRGYERGHGRGNGGRGHGGGYEGYDA